MEAETMLADSKVTPHKRAAYSLAVHRSKRTDDPDCICSSCDKDAEYSGDFLNVIYNKVTTISSILPGNGGGCLLTNGIVTPTTGATCFHSNDDDLTPYFTIDMAGVYTINKVEFTRRDTGGSDNTKRMWALVGSVDGDVCFSWPTYRDDASLRLYEARSTYSVTCGHEVTGRYLRFRKRKEPNYDWYYHISLCEVTIWVCKPKTFGTTSCQACPSAERCRYVCNNLYGCDTVVPWNVAIHKKALRSSAGNPVDPSKSIDGIISDPHSCVSMNKFVDIQQGSWWQVDMAATYKVYRLYVHPRLDCCAELMDSFDVFVEDYAMKSNSSLTKKCASHRDNTVKAGSVILLTCDPSLLNQGRYVILLATPDHYLYVCEVRVMGHNVIVYQAGDSCAGQNEIKRCHLDHVCTKNICKIKFGSACTESNHKHCINGTTCDGGTCKLDFDADCTGNADMCRFEAACDPVRAKCKWNLNRACNTTDSCVSGTECDELNTCKRPVGGNCDSTLECQSGSQCQLATGSTKKCVCSSSGSGSCDPNTGFSGGECATEDTCLASHLTCIDNICKCDAGYTAFAANFTCKVAVNFPCDTSADCNTGMECVSNVCKYQAGQRCMPGENQCKPAHACGFDAVCRLEVEADCSNHPLLCKSGAMCEAGLCKLMAGVICTVARGTECGAGTICSENKHDNITSKTCRLSPGQPCLGTDVTNCKDDSLCEEDVCKLRLDSDCVGANAGHCKSGTTCEFSKCKADATQACIDASQCQSTAVCDSITQTCQKKKGETCSSGVRQCMSGATCVPRSGGGMVCQCTVNKNVNQETDGCESVANAVGGSCTDTSCSDPNAICNNGICECINSTTIENSNYTCGYGPGVDCRNNTSACNSGTFCDRNGQCLLTVGQSCKKEKRGHCSTGLVCDKDICKPFLHMDCGDHSDLCMTGTVCDVMKKCKLAQGSHCGENSVCVGGAKCQDSICNCNDDISRANGSICESLTGKVLGECTGGTTCEDQNAICNEAADLCKCKQGYVPEPTTLACSVDKGESCEGKPSLCITGSECDPTTQTCRLMLGQICNKDMDCMTASICDIDGLCKSSFNETCTANNLLCRSNTVCDQLKKCRYGEAQKCNNTEQCVAGAVCTRSNCICSRNISNTYGAICAPNEGRIGSDCDGVKKCDATLGGKCGPTLKCECPAGTPILHDFRCHGFSGKNDDVANSNKSVKQNLALILGVVIGTLGFLSIVCLGVGLFGRRKGREKQDVVMDERLANMKELKALALTVETNVAGTSKKPIATESILKEGWNETSNVDGGQNVGEDQQLSLESPDVSLESSDGSLDSSDVIQE